MAVVTYRIPSGLCNCLLNVGGEENRVAVAEVSSLGAVVALQGTVRRHEYVDVILEVEGHSPLTLFAHVVNVRSQLVHLRWLHFDPGEEQVLAKQLEKIFAPRSDVQRAEGSGAEFAWKQEQGTRRIQRRNKVVVPGSQRAESEPSARQQTADDAIQAKEIAAPSPSGEVKEHKTRRVVRPRQTTTDPGTASSSRRMSVQAVSAPPQEESISEATEATQSEEDEYSAADAQAAVQHSALDGGLAAQASEPEGLGDSTSHTRKRSHDDVAVLPTDRLSRLPEVQQDGATAMHTGSLHYKDEASRKILSRARTVQASELAARHDKVRVLNMSTIKELIKESVAEAIVDINTGIDSERLAQEVERRVDEQLQAFKAEKEDYAARAKRLEEQLSHARDALERERRRAIEANQFTVSDAGIVDLEQRLERLVASSIRRNGVNDVLAEELRSMVGHLLDDERDKIAEQARKSQADTIELLERKIERLSGSLSASQKEAERQKRTLAAMGKSGGGLALHNIMTAGLDEDDPEAERKKELMREIVEQNRAMRAAYIKEHGSLPGRERAEARAAQKEAAREQPETSETEDPSAVAEGETEAEVDTDVAGASEEGVVDPDDLPWEGPDENLDEEDDRPIKQIAVSPTQAAAQAPPLQITRSQAPVSEDEYDRQATEVETDEYLDPDDLPWEGPDESLDEADDRPIKQIAVSPAQAAAQAPPLQVRRSSDADASDEHDRLATEIDDADQQQAVPQDGDPDDLPWEGPPLQESQDDADASSVRRISVSSLPSEPPPLERRGQS